MHSSFWPLNCALQIFLVESQVTIWMPSPTYSLWLHPVERSECSPSVCLCPLYVRSSPFIVATLFLISGFFRERRGNLTGKINRRREIPWRLRRREFNLKSFLPLLGSLGSFPPFSWRNSCVCAFSDAEKRFSWAQGLSQGSQ